MSLILKKRKKWFAWLLLPFFLISCTEVRLIGVYNPNVDQSIQTISKDVSTLFAEIEANVQDGKDFSYDTMRDFYIKIEGEIQGCITVAQGIPKYGIITGQLNLLSTALDQLKQLHMTGFAAPGATKEVIIKAVELNKSAFVTAFTGMLKLQEGLKREKADKS